MPTERKFFRTIIEVEVLSEDVPLEFDNLAEVEHAISEGDCSGRHTVTKVEQVDGPTTARLLREQASEPGFFMLDDDGNDLTDENE